VPSGVPAASSATTSALPLRVASGSAVSNPLRVAVRTARPFSRSCHDATSVAPFQLAWIVPPRTAAAGRSTGRPSHEKRKAR
jgi:hypothetical protein